MKYVASAVLVMSALLAGCQSNESDPVADRARLMAMKPAIDSVPSSGLGPQTLAPGECGLFLWSQTDVSKFIFFSRALSDSAVFAQGEDPVSLSQTLAGGDIFGQFNTRMTYVSNDGRQLELSVTPGELLDGGQRIEQGLLSLTDREGWLTKLPVLGVRACQPE